MNGLLIAASVFAAIGTALYLFGGEALQPYFTIFGYPAAVCLIAWVSGRFFNHLSR